MQQFEILGHANKKAPESIEGARKRIWKTLSDHAPLAHDNETARHGLSPLRESLVSPNSDGNMKCNLQFPLVSQSILLI